MSRALYTDFTAATMAPGAPYGLIEHAAMAVEQGRIAWIGACANLPERFADLDSISLEGRLATPALIDCHTHLVFGGDRATEFEMRLRGASYEELARASGGVVSTVKATRAASEDALFNDALPRLDALIAEGVRVIEIKSGYGLDHDTELCMLRAARRLARARPVKIVTSFLGAHAIPPEFADRADAYISEVCLPALDAVAARGLADAVDGFCEGIAFSPDQIEQVFQRAQSHGLPVKLHAEQLSNLGGAALAARYGACSVDHIEYLDQAGVEAIAAAGTVAVLLPGAFYALRETQLPPVDALRAAGVPIAVATDANPGSSPMFSLLLAMNMACTLFRLTPEEALAGATREAAKALGLAAEFGVLEIGKRADLCLWEVRQPAELAYRIGFNPLRAVIREGELCRRPAPNW